MVLPVEGNLHQFTAGPEGAAFLDVLTPPYDHPTERPCTYYNDDGAVADGVHLVRPINPTGFWGDCQPYAGPAIDE